MRKIYFNDLRREYKYLKDEIQKKWRDVFNTGWFILGKQLEKFENEFARYSNVAYAVGVASGTEALQISLMALGIGCGCEVITAVNTAIPTAMAVVATGARPKFVDVNKDSFNIDIDKLESVISKKTKVIIPVHLYGNPCDIAGIIDIAKKNDLFVIEDCCQAHGADYNGEKVGTFGNLGAFSFYPTKNLGCYGDGGMIVTNDKRLADKAAIMRNYGQSDRYRCKIAGINSRLDEVQAAILRVKLKYLDYFNNKRREIASKYNKYLNEINEINIPHCSYNSGHVFHLYVIRCKNRDGLRKYLSQKGIETQIHYPIPLHMQEAFRGLGYRRGDFKCAEALSQEILSLPIYPELKDDEIRIICNYIKDFYKK